MKIKYNLDLLDNLISKKRKLPVDPIDLIDFVKPRVTGKQAILNSMQLHQLPSEVDTLNIEKLTLEEGSQKSSIKP